MEDCHKFMASLDYTVIPFQTSEQRKDTFFNNLIHWDIWLFFFCIFIAI